MSSLMEQYLLQVPPCLVDELKEKIENDDLQDIECIADGDNIHFEFHMKGKVYPATLLSIPCIVETHKTYDNMLFYKSGDISQKLYVFENKEQQLMMETSGVLSGVTPPTTNIVTRKYAYTKKTKMYPKEEVVRVEEELMKLLTATWPKEYVDESVVDFQEWMIDEKHPRGITVVNEMEFIMKNPQYLELDRGLSETTSSRTNDNIMMETNGLSKKKSNGIVVASEMMDEDAALENDLFGDL